MLRIFVVVTCQAVEALALWAYVAHVFQCTSVLMRRSVVALMLPTLRTLLLWIFVALPLQTLTVLLTLTFKAFMVEILIVFMLHACEAPLLPTFETLTLRIYAGRVAQTSKVIVLGLVLLAFEAIVLLSSGTHFVWLIVIRMVPTFLMFTLATFAAFIRQILAVLLAPTS